MSVRILERAHSRQVEHGTQNLEQSAQLTPPEPATLPTPNRYVLSRPGQNGVPEYRLTEAVEARRSKHFGSFNGKGGERFADLD